MKSCGQCLGCRLDKGRSRKGAWIEIEDIFKLGFVTISRSRKGAWIEINNLQRWWLKFDCRSRKGAWIEISTRLYGHKYSKVAPVRERGLKSKQLVACKTRLKSLP